MNFRNCKSKRISDRHASTMSTGADFEASVTQQPDPHVQVFKLRVHNVPYTGALDDFQTLYEEAMDDAVRVTSKISHCNETALQFHVHMWYERPLGKTDLPKVGGFSLSYETEPPARRAFNAVQTLTRRHHGLKIQAPKHFCAFCFDTEIFKCLYRRTASKTRASDPRAIR